MRTDPLRQSMPYIAAALAMSGSSLLVAMSALLLERARLKGLQ